MFGVVELDWSHNEHGVTRYEGALFATLDLIKSADPAFATELHASKQPPPFSANLYRRRLRIGFTDVKIIHALSSSHAASRTELIEHSDFDQLLRDAGKERSNTVDIRFVSPVCFSSSGKYNVLPAPSQFFGSLARRWRSIEDSPELPDLDFNHVITTNCHKLQSRKIQLSRYAAYGTTGKLTFLLPKEDSCWYRAMLALSAFTGVGSRTSQGFGRIAYEFK